MFLKVIFLLNCKWVRADSNSEESNPIPLIPLQLRGISTILNEMMIIQENTLNFEK